MEQLLNFFGGEECFSLMIIFCVNCLSKIFSAHPEKKKKKDKGDHQARYINNLQWVLGLDSIFISVTGRIVPAQNNLKSKVPIQKFI